MFPLSVCNNSHTSRSYVSKGSEKRRVARKKDRHSGRNERWIFVWNTKERQPDVISYIRIYIVYTWIRIREIYSEIEQSLPRCCTRFFKRVPFIQSTIIYVYIYIYVYVCRLFFPEYTGDFPPAGMQIEQEKRKRTKEKHILIWGTAASVISRTCRTAAIFDNCQRQRNAPSLPSPPRVRAINLYLQT